MTKFKFYLKEETTGLNREKVIDIPDAELEGLSIEETISYIRNKYYEDWVGEQINTGFYEIY